MRKRQKARSPKRKWTEIKEITYKKEINSLVPPPPISHIEKHTEIEIEKVEIGTNKSKNQLWLDQLCLWLLMLH